MTDLVVTPIDLTMMQTQAEANTDWVFGTSTTSTNAAAQACIYAVKAILAKSVVDWGMEPDSLLVDEASDRGISVEQLCQEILTMARAEQARERARIKAKIAIRLATTRGELLDAMLQNNVPIMNMPGVTS